MNILTALKITIIFVLLLIMFKSSKEGLTCNINYKFLHYPLDDKLLVKKYKNNVTCDNTEFSDYFNSY